MSTTVTSRPPLVRRRSAPAWKFSLREAFIFWVAASCAFTVSLGGQLLYGEILLVLALPFLILREPHAIFRKEYRTVYLLMGLWIFSQVITDIYVGAEPANRIKGIARVVFFAIDLAGVSALIGASLRRVVIFALGMAASAIFALHDQLGSAFATLWKMDIGPSLSFLLLLLVSPLYVKRKYAWILLILLGMAAANVHYGVRSQVLINLVTGLFLLPIFPKSPHGLHLSAHSRWTRILVLLAMGGVAAWTSQKLINWALSAGIYGEAEEQKFQQQSGGKYGVIFGGRPEGPVAIQAILDSPILGHGSYAVDPKYRVLLQDYRYEFGYSESDDPDDTDDAGIPTHSHLTMAWVEGGVLASIFWFYILGLLGRSVIRLTEISHPLTPFYVYNFVGLAWDILFSPFGQIRRMSEAFLIFIMVGLLARPAPRHARIDARFRSRRPVLRRRAIVTGENFP